MTQTGSMGVISAASTRHPRPSKLMMGILAPLHKAVWDTVLCCSGRRTSIHRPVTQQPRASDADGHHHCCADENARLRPAMGKTIAVNHRADGLTKMEEG